jgi:hypothetical protein
VTGVPFERVSVMLRSAAAALTGSPAQVSSPSVMRMVA